MQRRRMFTFDAARKRTGELNRVLRWLPLLASVLCIVAVSVVAQDAGEQTTSEEAEAGYGEWQPMFDGKTLEGWKSTPFFRAGEIDVEDGTLILNKGYMTGVNWTGSFPLYSYEIRWEAKRVEGKDFFSSLTFPFHDTHGTFITGGWGGYTVGLSCVDGWDASENQTTAYWEFENDEWNSFWLTVNETRIRAWINNELAFDVDATKHWISLRLGEIEKSVPLGFATYSTTGVLRNIEYRTLPPTVSEAENE